MQRARFRQHADVFAEASVYVALFNRTRLNLELDKRLHVRSQRAMLGREEGKLIDELISHSPSINCR